MSEPEPLTITVSEHLFRIRVTQELRERCQHAEVEANARLEEIVSGGGMSGPRALAMLAYEACVEIEELREEVARLKKSAPRIEQIIQKIDSITTAPH